MTRLDVQRLDFSYGKRHVLKQVSLQVAAGEIVGLVGPNGSGKTTLLKIVSGLLSGYRGTVSYDGAPLTRLSRRQAAQYCAYVHQETWQPFAYRVADMVAMGRAHASRWYRAPNDEAVFHEALAEVGLNLDADRLMNELSGGERQLVLLARALVQSDRLLVLDEPVSHLDLKHQRTVVSALKKRAQKGSAVLWSVHDLQLAALMCDTIYLLCQGEIVVKGPPHEALESDLLSKVFDVSLDVIPKGASHALWIGFHL